MRLVHCDFIMKYVGMLTVFYNIPHLGQAWYIFKNMGPTPSARSGHAMASFGTRVFVLGGKSSLPGQLDDPAVVHVLETSKYSVIITYTFTVIHRSQDTSIILCWTNLPFPNL